MTGLSVIEDALLSTLTAGRRRVREQAADLHRYITEARGYRIVPVTSDCGCPCCVPIGEDD